MNRATTAARCAPRNAARIRITLLRRNTGWRRIRAAARQRHAAAPQNNRASLFALRGAAASARTAPRWFRSAHALRTTAIRAGAARWQRTVLRSGGRAEGRRAANAVHVAMRRESARHSGIVGLTAGGRVAGVTARVRIVGRHGGGNPACLSAVANLARKRVNAALAQEQRGALQRAACARCARLSGSSRARICGCWRLPSQFRRQNRLNIMAAGWYGGNIAISFA